jgi:nucleoside-diphosphate-sugar epimerase
MIAITGGNGPMARLLIEELSGSGERVRVLCPEPVSFDSGRVTLVHGTIFDVNILEELMDGVSQVYHLDTLDTFRPKVRMDLYRSNVEGTANVVNVALSLGVRKLLFNSTIFSLGDQCDHRPFDETSKWSNTKSASGYGWSMHLAEREVWRGVSEGLPAVILHAGIVPVSPGYPGISSEILDFCLHDRRPPAGRIHLVDPADLVMAMTRLMNGPFENEQFIVFSHEMAYPALKDLFADKTLRRPGNRAVSYMSLSRKALYRRFNFLTRRNRPMLSRSLARAVSDDRVFSNRKISQLFPSGFIDIGNSLRKYRSLYDEQGKFQ